MLLTARFARAACEKFDRPIFVVVFDALEGHVTSYVEHTFAPEFVLRVVGIETGDQIRKLGKVALGRSRAARVDAFAHDVGLHLPKFRHFRQTLVGDADPQVGLALFAAVERHLRKGVVHFFHARLDLAAFVFKLVRKVDEVLLGVIFQQLPEALFVLRQTVGFELFKQMQIVFGRGVRHVHRPGFKRPKRFEFAKRLEHFAFETLFAHAQFARSLFKMGGKARRPLLDIFGREFRAGALAVNDVKPHHQLGFGRFSRKAPPYRLKIRAQL